MKCMRKVSILFAIMALPILTSSCFIIGTAVGSSVAKKRDAKRPVIKPELDAINELEVGTWVDLVWEDSKITSGKYVEATGDSIPIIKLKIPGEKANQIMVLNEIDHIVVGHKPDGPKLAGTMIGLAVDGIVGTIIAVAINNSISH
jgi:hypothetical protein